MLNVHPGPDPVTIDGPAAERLTSLSEKTLKRAHDRGEAVGRLRVGRAVRYHKPTLLRWLEAQTAVTPTPTH